MATVLDNASNFAKAFEEFNITVVSEDQDEIEVKDLDLSYITINPEGEEMSVCLSHIRYGTHTLSLVSTTDAKKAIKDYPALSKLNHSTMPKCSALCFWQTKNLLFMIV